MKFKGPKLARMPRPSSRVFMKIFKIAFDRCKVLVEDPFLKYPLIKRSKPPR